MGLEIEDEAVVQVLLNVERNLGAADRSIVAETNLDGNVEAGVVIRMNVEGDSRGQERG